MVYLRITAIPIGLGPDSNCDIIRDFAPGFVTRGP